MKVNSRPSVVPKRLAIWCVSVCVHVTPPLRGDTVRMHCLQLIGKRITLLASSFTPDSADTWTQAEVRGFNARRKTHQLQQLGSEQVRWIDLSTTNVRKSAYQCRPCIPCAATSVSPATPCVCVCLFDVCARFVQWKYCEGEGTGAAAGQGAEGATTDPQGSTAPKESVPRKIGAVVAARRRGAGMQYLARFVGHSMEHVRDVLEWDRCCVGCGAACSLATTTCASLMAFANRVNGYLLPTSPLTSSRRSLRPTRSSVTKADGAANTRRWGHTQTCC